MAKSKITSSVIADLEKFKEEKLRVIRLEVMKVIKDTEIQATYDAPNFVKIDGVISDGGYSGEVGVMGSSESKESKMAAYIEFGTGLSAVQILAPYPQEVKDTAMAFYVNGQGTLTGSPYLFNNFLKNYETFKSNLIKLGLKEK